MAGKMNLSQIRDALAQTMSEEVITKGEAGVYTKDAEGGWKLYDESVCTILIYKQPLQDRFRVVAMTAARKCIINSWIKPFYTIVQTPPNFIEVTSSSPSSPPTAPDTIPLEGTGLAFSDPLYLEIFNKHFSNCQQAMADGAPGALRGSTDSLMKSLSGETTTTTTTDGGSSLSSSGSSLTSSGGGSNSPFAIPANTNNRRGSVSLVKSASTTVPDLYGTLRAAPVTSSSSFSSGSIGRKGGSSLAVSAGSGTVTGRTRKFSLSQRKKLNSISFDSPNLLSMQSVVQDILTNLDHLLDAVWQCLHFQPEGGVATVKSGVGRVAEALQMLSIITAAEYGEGSHAKDVVLSNATAVQEELTNIKADTHIATAVEKGLAFYASALRTTSSAVGHHAVFIRGLEAQMENIVSNLQVSPENDKPALLLVAVTRALATSVSSLCSSISTYSILNSPTYSQTTSRYTKQNLTPNDVNIWTEVPLGAEVKVVGAAHATLNQLIALLVSDTKYDPEYMKMFITMFESFTNPYILLEKLTQRHNVPSTVDTSRVPALQLRVSVVLKYWIDNHGDEFDDDVASRIEQFIDTDLRNAGHGEMAMLLLEQLRKKMEASMAQKESLNHIPPHMTNSFSDFSSPADLLLLTPPGILAEQLTLIDYAIFRDIEPRELQNQSWNKADIKACRSPNVIRLINRSTQVSYWVATMILMHTKVEDRVKVWEKIIDISKALLKLHNYNTLMSIIAGLNNSCVFRLKKTRKKLLSSARDTLAAVEKVMSTQQSFKNYRNALREASPPCMPYLGVHLSDLVFIEDGNADKLNGEINVRKRELIYTVIKDLLHYKQYPYPAQKHTTYDFLSSLPTLNEKELYTISIFLEPRK